jgi:Fe2+ or Zn2+ uptake regulation protein
MSMMKSSKDRNTVQNLKRGFHKLDHRLTNQRASIWQLFSNAPHGYTIQEAAGVLKKEGIGHAKATNWNYMDSVPNAGRPCRRMDLNGSILIPQYMSWPFT